MKSETMPKKKKSYLSRLGMTLLTILLGLSTDQTGIIDHSGSTLDLTYQGHDKNEKNDQQYS